MAIDLRRIALAAVEAAVNEQREAPQQQKQKKRGLGAGRALLLALRDRAQRLSKLSAQPEDKLCLMGSAIRWCILCRSVAL